MWVGLPTPISWMQTPPMQTWMQTPGHVTCDAWCMLGSQLPSPRGQKESHTLLKILPCPKLHLRAVIKCLFTQWLYLNPSACKINQANQELKILTLFVSMGLSTFSDIVACVDPDECYSYCQSRSGCSNIAYPKLVLGIMPSGNILRQIIFMLFSTAGSFFPEEIKRLAKVVEITSILYGIYLAQSF